MTAEGQDSSCIAACPDTKVAAGRVSSLFFPFMVLGKDASLHAELRQLVT